MSEINAFDVLKRMSLDNERTLKMFPGDTNFLEAKQGNKGWGKVIMAVDNGTLQELSFDDQTVCVLLFYNMDKYRETKQKILLEKKNEKFQ
jgi:hypothetical protein